MAIKQRTRRRSFEDYLPVANPLEPSIDYLETYGPEYALVLAQQQKDPTKVWTIMSGDDGRMYVCAGWHFVNRMNYVITERSWENDNISYRW